jgi:hypothetical protein
MDFIGCKDLGPYEERSAAFNDVNNLLRQHFAAVATARGLLPVEFASGETGWYFPHDLIPANRITFTGPDGRRIRRTLSGKFKNLRWHLCLQAKPRIWPSLVFRIRGNVVLSDNGVILSGAKSHKRRRRLTRSWWNDVWRDRLLAAMNFLASGGVAIEMKAGNICFTTAAWPLTVRLPVSYEATDPPLPTEEDEEGNIVPVTLEDYLDDLEGEEELEDIREPDA